MVSISSLVAGNSIVSLLPLYLSCFNILFRIHFYISEDPQMLEWLETRRTWEDNFLLNTASPLCFYTKQKSALPAAPSVLLQRNVTNIFSVPQGSFRFREHLLPARAPASHLLLLCPFTNLLRLPMNTEHSVLFFSILGWWLEIWNTVNVE